MAKQWTKTESFGFFGVTMVNVRWSWSGRSSDGQTVVLGLWSDRFVRDMSPIQYDGSLEKVEGHRLTKPGNVERLENLKWAVRSCDGRFRVVMLIAKNTQESPREIKDAFPKPEMLMRVVELNEDTGEFRAELVEPT